MSGLKSRVLNKLRSGGSGWTAVDHVINGRSFRIPILETVGKANVQDAEPWMVDVLKSLDLEGGLIDVGVNVGQTLLKFRSVYDSAPYVGFEPNPLCVHYTNKLIAANNIAQADVYPTGISDDSGYVKIHYYSDELSDPSASIVEGYRPDNKIARSELIRVSTFSQIEKECSLPSNAGAVKIDVEGAESLVLSSMKDYLSRQRIPVIIEILPVYNEENTERLNKQQSIEQIIADLNYSIHRIDKSEGTFAGLSPIDSFGIHGDLTKCDYILMPA